MTTQCLIGCIKDKASNLWWTEGHHQAQRRHCGMFTQRNFTIERAVLDFLLTLIIPNRETMASLGDLACWYSEYQQATRCCSPKVTI